MTSKSSFSTVEFRATNLQLATGMFGANLLAIQGPQGTTVQPVSHQFIRNSKNLMIGGVNPDTPHGPQDHQDHQDTLEHHTLTIIPCGGSYVNVMPLISP